MAEWDRNEKELGKPMSSMSCHSAAPLPLESVALPYLCHTSSSINEACKRRNNSIGHRTTKATAQVQRSARKRVRECLAAVEEGGELVAEGAVKAAGEVSTVGHGSEAHELR